MPFKCFDDRCIKTKRITRNDKVYTNFCALNVPENDIERESFADIYIDFSLAYERKYYLQVYLDNCTYKIVNRQTIYYLDENLFEDQI